MLRLANVAVPFTAATLVVPDSVPLPGFVPIVTATLPAKPVAVLPCPSNAVTWTAGVIVVPATAFEGCTENTRRAAAPAPMANGALAIVGTPLAAAVRV